MAETRIEIEVPGTLEMQGKLAAKPNILRRGILKALRMSGESIYARALENVSGKVLKVRTGTLRRRLMYFVDKESLSVSVGSPVAYAAIHEYGGRTAPHIIRAIHKRSLAFPKSGGAGALLTRTKSGKVRKSNYNRGLLVFVKSVHHPGSVIPARPFLHPALDDSIPAIKQNFTDALGESLKEAQ